MQYREFGKTGKKVSLLGFGGNRFLESDLQDQEGLERCANLVRYAKSQGINYFDCSPSYAKGYNEKILGMGLKQIKGPIYISAKSGLQIDKTADDIRRRIHTTLSHLDMEKISFYHIWSVMSLEEYKVIMQPGGLYAGVWKAKEEGLVEHICISVHCSDEEILKIISEDAFEGITIVFNPINYRAKIPIIEKAHEKGWGIATMNSLSGGLIPRYPDLFEGLDDSSNSAVQKALRFNGQFHEISVILSGMPTLEQITENVSAFDTGITTKEAKDIHFTLPIQDAICSGCRYCTGCPKGIAVADYMQAYNLKLILGGQEPGQGTDQMFHELRGYGVEPLEEDVCIQCGRCERRCTRQIPIIQRLKEMRNLAAEHFYTVQEICGRIDAFRQTYEGKKIAIWPSCVYADRVLDLYDAPEWEKDCEFFNSSKEKQGTMFRGKPVHSGDEVLSMGMEVILILTWKYKEEIFDQLTKEYGTHIPVVLLQDREEDISWFN